MIFILSSISSLSMFLKNAFSPVPECAAKTRSSILLLLFIISFKTVTFYSMLFIGLFIEYSSLVREIFGISITPIGDSFLVVAFFMLIFLVMVLIMGLVVLLMLFTYVGFISIIVPISNMISIFLYIN